MGIRNVHQTCESGLGHANRPQTNLDAKPALVAFRAADRAHLPPPRTSRRVTVRARGEPHYVPPLPVAPHTVRFLAEFRATSPSFRAILFGKQNCIPFACLWPLVLLSCGTPHAQQRIARVAAPIAAERLPRGFSGKPSAEFQKKTACGFKQPGTRAIVLLPAAVIVPTLGFVTCLGDAGV